MRKSGQLEGRRLETSGSLCCRKTAAEKQRAEENRRRLEEVSGRAEDEKVDRVFRIGGEKKQRRDREWSTIGFSRLGKR